MTFPCLTHQTTDTNSARIFPMDASVLNRKSASDTHGCPRLSVHLVLQAIPICQLKQRRTPSRAISASGHKRRSSTALPVVRSWRYSRRNRSESGHSSSRARIPSNNGVARRRGHGQSRASDRDLVATERHQGRPDRTVNGASDKY